MLIFLNSFFLKSNLLANYEIDEGLKLFSIHVIYFDKNADAFE